MFRYVALTWNESDSNATVNATLIAGRMRPASSEWRTALALPGLTVFYTDARPDSSQIYPMAGGCGVVLGKLFRSSDITSIATAPVCLANETAEIVRTRGRRLVEGYWGRYVAFHRERHERSTWVLRDPTGALPCYTTEHRGVQIFFSYVEDCLTLGLLKFSLDWRYLAAYVRYGRVLQSPETGIKEIAEIQPGEYHEVRGDGSLAKSQYWKPTDLARSNLIENIDQATEALKATTQTCVAAWGSIYPRILHLLSGGLDSSIVLNCLSRASQRPQVDCLTYFNTASPAGDERRYAKAAAENAGYALTELEERASDTQLNVIMKMARSATPWSMQYYATHHSSESKVAREKNSAAIFYGSGGDQIFFQGPVPLTAVDYAHQRGLRKSLFKVSAQVALQSQLSFWSVLSNSVRNGFLRRPWNPATNCREMLVAAASLKKDSSLEKYLNHPWLKETRGLPWGKLEHIRMMSVSHDFYNPLSAPDGPERVRPLVSQPLIELALRIQTYALAAHGYDRLAARRAFANELPKDIARRRTKGIISNYFHQLLHHNADFIRELMADGLLASKGLLDRDKVIEALDGKRAGFGAEASEIVVYHLGTEVWARRWAESKSLAAA